MNSSHEYEFFTWICVYQHVHPYMNMYNMNSSHEYHEYVDSHAYVDICGYMWIYVDICGYMWKYVDILVKSTWICGCWCTGDVHAYMNIYEMNFRARINIIWIPHIKVHIYICVYILKSHSNICAHICIYIPLQHTVTPWDSLRLTATHCNTLFTYEYVTLFTYTLFTYEYVTYSYVNSVYVNSVAFTYKLFTYEYVTLFTYS